LVGRRRNLQEINTERSALVIEVALEFRNLLP
jgi:hypothetical protein